MPTQIVNYRVDDGLTASFEIVPVPGFVPASTREMAGHIRESVGPAIEAARVVLERARELCPDQVDVKFGVKVTGTANWIVAKAATEGNFEVTLSWRADPALPAPGDGAV